MPITAILAAQYAGTFEALDTTTGDVRANQQSTTAAAGAAQAVQTLPNLAYDVATTATARLRLSGRQLESTIAYSPSLTIGDLELAFDPELLHNGSVTLAWHDRFVRIAVAEAASYGKVLAAAPYQGTAAPAESTPPGQTATLPVTPPPQPLLLQAVTGYFDYGATDTSANVAVRTDRRLTFGVGGGYHLSGGLNAESQAVLPKQYGPRATATVSYAASRVDTLDTILTGQETLTIGPCPPGLQPAAPAGTEGGNATPLCREDAPSAQLEETYRHLLSRTATVIVSAGVAPTVEITADFQRKLVVEPVAVVTYTDRLDTGGSNVLLSAQIAPAPDLRTGLLGERLMASAALGRLVAPGMLLTVNAGLQQSLPLPVSELYPLTALNGGFLLRTRLNRQLDVLVGGQVLWQTQTDYGTLSTEILTLGVTVRAPPVRF